VHSLERRRPAPGAPSKNSNPTFKVGVEISAGADPVTASDVSSNSSAAIKEEPTSLDQLHRFASNGYLFALLDATDQILVPHKAKLLGPTKAVSLFTGTANEWYWAVAPYLFQVDSELLDWIAEKLWKEPWGIFAMSKANLEDLRLHFKKFLMVNLPDGKQWLFRYYDPRILQAYLPTCEPWELQKFFGPVRAFATADTEEQNLMTLAGTPQGVSEQPKPNPEAGMFWTIRPEQYHAFNQAAEENFVDRSIKFLQDKLPDQVNSLAHDLLRKRVEAGLAHARSYGVTWRSSLLMFLTLMFEVSPNFDHHGLVQPLLRDQALVPDQRIKKIVGNLSGENWRQVAQEADQSAWDTLLRSANRAR
jgi:hypothetical protein